jgi:hypothetical protein
MEVSLKVGSFGSPSASGVSARQYGGDRDSLRVSETRKEDIARPHFVHWGGFMAYPRSPRAWRMVCTIWPGGHVFTAATATGLLRGGSEQGDDQVTLRA